MHYYIDGYNLLFRSFGIGEGDLQQQRKQLIQKLQYKIEYLSLDVTIVFDAHLQTGELSQFHLVDLKILFTPAGQNADEYILEALDHVALPQQETIVTSDRELAWRARRKGARTESVEAFVKWINKRCKDRKKKEKSSPTPQRLVLPSALIYKKQTEKPAASENISKPAPAAGSLEYYLEVFEKKLHVEDEQMETFSKSQAKKGARLGKTTKKKPSPNSQSEMARWLKIFEERDHQT